MNGRWGYWWGYILSIAPLRWRKTAVSAPSQGGRTLRRTGNSEIRLVGSAVPLRSLDQPIARDAGSFKLPDGIGPRPVLPVTAAAYNNPEYSQRTKAWLSWRAQKAAGLAEPCCCTPMTDEMLAHLSEADIEPIWGPR